MKFGAWLVILALVALAGCTERAASVRPHDAAPAPYAPSAPPAEEAKPADSELVRAKRAEPAFNADPVKGGLAPLSDVVLAVSRVRDPRSLTDKKVRDDLAAFNALVLELAPDHGGRPEFGAIVAKFAATLAVECGPGKEDCVGYKYLRLASNSSLVMKLAAKRETRPAERLKLLFAAVELKNTVWDPELSEAILMLAVSKEAGADPALKALIARSKSVLETTLRQTLQNLVVKRASPEQARKLLDSIDGWKLAAPGGGWGLESASRDALYEAMAKHGYGYSGNRGGLSPAFVAAIEALEAEPGSLRKRQETLRAQKLFVPAAVGAELTDVYDELIFALDGVFLGKLSPEAGRAIVASSSKSAAEIERTVVNFIRVQFAVALYESTRMAKSIFNASVETEELLWHAMRESASVKRVWGALKGQMEPLRGLSMFALREKGAGAASLARIDGVFASYDKSVNLSAVYPHTLILFYMLSKKRFDLALPMSGRRFNSADLMNILYEGELPPLLEYSDETAPLNHFQLLHSFDFAVRSNLFSIIDIDPDAFIAETIGRLNEGPSKQIQGVLDRVRQHFAQAKSYPQLQLACAEIEAAAKGERPRTTRSFYISEMPSSVYYGRVIGDAFTDVTSSSGTMPSGGSLGKIDLGVFYPDREYSEALEKTRLNVGGNLRLGRAMIAAYRSYLARFKGADAAELDRRTSESRGSLKRLEDLRSRVLASSEAWYREIGKCYFRLEVEEHRMQESLLRTEQAYLRKVHRDMKRLRSDALSPEERARLVASYRFTGLPSEFPGKDQILPHGYHYTQVDLFVRFSRYMREGLRTETESIAALAPHVDVNMGVRMDDEVDWIHKTPTTFLPYVDSEAEFVTSGMKAIFSQHRPNATFVHWLSYPTGRILNWSPYLLSLANLYRLEWDMKGSSSIIGAKDVLRAQETMLDIMKFSQFERDLYRSVSVPRRYGESQPHRLLLVFDYEVTQQVQSLWGLFDLPMRMMDSEELGRNYDEPNPMKFFRFGSLTAGRQYYRARSPVIRGESIIPFNNDLDRELDESVSRFVKADLASVAAFNTELESYLKGIAARPPAERPWADLSITETIRGPLLSDSLLSGHHSKIRSFHQGTQRCFEDGRAACAEMK